MEKSEMLWIASKAVAKGYDSGDEVKYSDDLYGKEQYVDDVMEYVTELHEIGRVAFYQKYADFKLY